MGAGFRIKIMPIQNVPVSAAEAKSLFSDLEQFSALVLAVSGGPDSTALMVLAARWRKSFKKKPALIAVTVDHGLRAESKREAAAAGKLDDARAVSARAGRREVIGNTLCLPRRALSRAAAACRSSSRGEASNSTLQRARAKR